MSNTTLLALVLLTAGFAAGAAQAQQPPPGPPKTPYGQPISLEEAKKVAAAAEAEAARLTGPVEAIAIVGPGGGLVYFERMDNTQFGSVEVAIDKARTAARFRRPSKVFADLVAKGNLVILGLHGAVPLEGGVPIVKDGRIIGAIGASGGTGAEDSQVAAAGIAALK